METDYVKYIVEPYKNCPVCKVLGMRLFKISVSGLAIGLFSDCKFCGHEIRETILKIDMIHNLKLFLEHKEVGSAFRRFVLGVNNRDLFSDDSHYDNFKEFFRDILITGRKTVYVRKGKKIKIPDFGKILEQYLDKTL